RHTSKIIEIILELSEYPFQKTETMKSLARYCSYDRRKRINFEQDMNTLFPLS
ncbi:MAG: IS4/IS5 family transposase, partial [Bacteroidetes bacterium CG02_land_8_20_14_3_00_31_25]